MRAKKLANIARADTANIVLAAPAHARPDPGDADSSR